MKLATKRTIIGAAALAAAGLFGSLPYEGASVAQSGIPTVHHDVALVDAIGLGEVTYDNGIHTDVVAPNGFEDTLYLAYQPNGAAYLDTGGTGGIFEPAYLNDFDGGATQLYDGYLADTVVVEDELNGLLGVQAADQSALFSTFEADYIGTVPNFVAVGPTFDAALTSLATTDDQAALTDFTAYGEYFLSNLSAFSTDGLFSTASLEAGFTAFTSGFDSLDTTFSTDFISLLTAFGI